MIVYDEKFIFLVELIKDSVSLSTDLSLEWSIKCIQIIKLAMISVSLKLGILETQNVGNSEIQKRHRNSGARKLKNTETRKLGNSETRKSLLGHRIINGSLKALNIPYPIANA